MLGSIGYFRNKCDEERNIPEKCKEKGNVLVQKEEKREKKYFEYITTCSFSVRYL